MSMAMLGSLGLDSSQTALINQLVARVEAGGADCNKYASYVDTYTRLSNNTAKSEATKSAAAEIAEVFKNRYLSCMQTKGVEQATGVTMPKYVDCAALKAAADRASQLAKTRSKASHREAARKSANEAMQQYNACVAANGMMTEPVTTVDSAVSAAQGTTPVVSLLPSPVTTPITNLLPANVTVTPNGLVIGAQPQAETGMSTTTKVLLFGLLAAVVVGGAVLIKRRRKAAAAAPAPLATVPVAKKRSRRR